MRHVPFDTLYPWIELACPVCGEDSDHPACYDDYYQEWDTEFRDPVCHCGHKYSMIEIKQRGTLYG